MKIKIDKVNVVFFVFYSVLLFLSYIIGNRELSVGTDTQTYANKFIRGVACKCMGDSEIGFETFLYPMYLLSFSPGLIFTILSFFIFLILFFISFKMVNGLKDNKASNLYLSYRDYIALFSLFLMIPIVLQIHINAIRQGVSALFLLVSFLYVLEGDKKKSFYCILLSVSFHYSAALILPLFVLFYYFNYRLIVVYLISIFVFMVLSAVYLLGFSEGVIKLLSEAFYLPVWKMVNEYGALSLYKTGVRYDFYFFSLVLMLPIFLYSIFSNTAKIYFSFLVICMVPFLLLGWGAYSNRYLLNLWLYIPFGFFGYLVLKKRAIGRLYSVLFIASVLINILQVRV